MANTFFQFKQFRIEQDKCAMKVCTDSCLFGAILPLVNAKGQIIRNAFEIGAGTGLLALQYAQKNAIAQITSIEIKTNAALQAKENVANSIFKNQIQILQSDFNTFTSTTKYDLIFCNPPFYEKELHGTDATKNIAHHSTALSMEFLLERVKDLLEENGVFCLLLPTKRMSYIYTLLAKNKCSVTERITIHQNEKRKEFRTILFLITNNSSSTIKESELLIKNKNTYSNTFQELLKPYYLQL